MATFRTWERMCATSSLKNKHRQPGLIFREDQVKDRPLSFQGILIKKLDAAEIDYHGGSGDFLLIEQVEKKVSNVLFIQSIRRVPVMFA